MPDELQAGESARAMYREQKLEALAAAVTGEIARARGIADRHALHPRHVLACWANGLTVEQALALTEQRIRNGAIA